MGEGEGERKRSERRDKNPSGRLEIHKLEIPVSEAPRANPPSAALRLAGLCLHPSLGPDYLRTASSQAASGAPVKLIMTSPLAGKGVPASFVAFP
jgi:hypothetical protein